MGLGPAGPDLLGEDARAAIAGAEAAYLRTSRHPAAAGLAEVASFDRHYEDSETFEEVYERIAEDLLAAARAVATEGGGSVVYAVPGSPLVAERTVELLRADPRVDVTVLPALSFLDLAWDRLAVDPLAASVRLVDGTRYREQAAGERGPLLIAQCWSTDVLSEVKLAVGEAIPAAGYAGGDGGEEPVTEPTVTVLHHLGLPDEVVVEVAWHELDRAVEADHLTSVWVPRLAAPVAAELVALQELVRRLRHDCPWDRQQTHSSLTRHLLEEAYETIDAIDALARARSGPEAAAATLHVEEELGDLLFQVYFHSLLAAEEGRFTLADVAKGVHDKLVSRHPHVFGDVVARDASTVLANWEEIKKAEKGRTSVTDGIPPALPALALAAKLQRKAAAVPGMTAPSLEDLRIAVATSLGELMADDASDAGRSGDLLWAVSDLVRRSGVEPEDALRTAALRFRDRVRAIEGADGADGPVHGGHAGHSQVPPP